MAHSPQEQEVEHLLRDARELVGQLERLLHEYRPQSIECRHIWTRVEVSGPRDNGEEWFRCLMCGQDP